MVTGRLTQSRTRRRQNQLLARGRESDHQSSPAERQGIVGGFSKEAWSMALRRTQIRKHCRRHHGTQGLSALTTVTSLRSYQKWIKIQLQCLEQTSASKLLLCFPFLKVFPIECQQMFRSTHFIKSSIFLGSSDGRTL